MFENIGAKVRAKIESYLPRTQTEVGAFVEPNLKVLEVDFAEFNTAKGSGGQILADYVRKNPDCMTFLSDDEVIGCGLYSDIHTLLEAIPKRKAGW